MSGRITPVSLRAAQVQYNNADSTLIAQLVKTAIDELDVKIIGEDLWDRVAGTPNYLLPHTSADDIGATGARITKGWFTDIDVATSIATKVLKAIDADGIEIQDDGGNVAHYIADGGKNRFGDNTTPSEMMEVAGNILSDVSGVDQTLILNDTTDVSKLVLNAGIDATNRINQGNLVIGAGTILASAILELVSTTKGFLPPRMTTAQRNAISTPAPALDIHDTDLKDRMFYNGSFWGTQSQSIRATAKTADYNPSALTDDEYVAFTDLSVSRTYTIPNEDIQSGTPANRRVIIVKDESYAASAVNTITIQLESGNINNAATFVINQPGDAVTINLDGTNGHVY